MAGSGVTPHRVQRWEFWASEKQDLAALINFNVAESQTNLDFGGFGSNTT